MLRGPFLTDADPRAKVKGSRDPLGLQAIWVSLGRHVVGNLTTVTQSVREFTTTLLGYCFVEHLRDAGSKESGLPAFLKWEQLCGYVQAERFGQNAGFRGIERVSRTLRETGVVTLGAAPQHQILSKQKVYGLWGLFTVPSHSSGLLEGEPVRLTNEAREFVQSEYLSRLDKAGFRDGREILDRLAEPTVKVDLRRKDRRLVDAVADLLRPKLSHAERTFYRDTLVRGGPRDRTSGLQVLMARLMPGLWNDSFAFDRTEVHLLAEHARREMRSDVLADRLHRIGWGEALVAPAAAAFAFLQSCGGQDPAAAAADIAARWGGGLPWLDLEGVLSLADEIASATGSQEVGGRWCEVGRALRQGDWPALITRLLEQNRWVMERRGGAPWIEVRNGRLVVRFRDELAALPEPGELEGSWRYTYFLDSLRTVSRAVGEV
ncbi:MAG: hypothetical protein HY907_09565 [Deltaproteobacteria bacterium]|nr:hypothetical protein [Deltaproteobacteria bacterium]